MPTWPALPATNLRTMPALPAMVEILPQPCSDGVETDMEGVHWTVQSTNAMGTVGENFRLQTFSGLFGQIS